MIPPVASTEFESILFRSSEQTDKLDEALAKAQSEIGHAHADSKNPHFKSTYADLASVWDAVRSPLSKNGISITQWPCLAPAGKMRVLTRLAGHGQWMMCGMEIPVGKPDAHGVGSALTYLRRYMLSAVAGVAPSDDPVGEKDDDGNAATGRYPRPGDFDEFNQDPSGRGPAFPVSGGPVAPKAAPSSAPPLPTTPHVPPELVTQEQLARMFTIAGERGWTVEQIRLYLKAKLGIDSTKSLTRGQYDYFVETLQTQSYERAMVQSFYK